MKKSAHPSYSHLLKVDLVDLEARLEYTGGKHTTSQDILFCRCIIRLLYDVHLVKETANEHAQDGQTNNSHEGRVSNLRLNKTLTT